MLEEAHRFWPKDVWCKHGGQVEGGHFVEVLIAGRVVQEVEQQLQEAAIGWRQQHEEQLKRLDLTLLVRDVRLVPRRIQTSQFCSQPEEVSRVTSKCLWL